MAASRCLERVRRQVGRDLFLPGDAQSAENICVSARQFLRARETRSQNDCTHVLIENFKDWWTGATPTCMLAIVEADIESFHQQVANLYDLGIPLALAEKCSPKMRLFVDVTIRGTKQHVIRAPDLLDVRGPFVEHFGAAIVELFPGHEFIDVAVFDATGFSNKFGVLVTSVHLVFPGIVVDEERALQTRKALAHRFSHADDLRFLVERFPDYHMANEWTNVLGATVSSPKARGVRMPLCDSVVPAPAQKLELRPLKPDGVLRFNVCPLKVERVVPQESDLTSSDWLQIGTIRRGAGAELSEFKLPIEQCGLAGGPRAPGPVTLRIQTEPRPRTQPSLMAITDGPSQRAITDCPSVRGRDTSGQRSASASHGLNEARVTRHLKAAGPAALQLSNVPSPARSQGQRSFTPNALQERTTSASRSSLHERPPSSQVAYEPCTANAPLPLSNGTLYIAELAGATSQSRLLFLLNDILREKLPAAMDALVEELAEKWREVAAEHLEVAGVRGASEKTRFIAASVQKQQQLVARITNDICNSYENGFGDSNFWRDSSSGAKWVRLIPLLRILEEEGLLLHDSQQTVLDWAADLKNDFDSRFRKSAIFWGSSSEERRQQMPPPLPLLTGIDIWCSSSGDNWVCAHGPMPLDDRQSKAVADAMFRMLSLDWHADGFVQPFLVDRGEILSMSKEDFENWKNPMFSVEAIKACLEEFNVNNRRGTTGVRGMYFSMLEGSSDQRAEQVLQKRILRDVSTMLLEGKLSNHHLFLAALRDRVRTQGHPDVPRFRLMPAGSQWFIQALLQPTQDRRPGWSYGR